MPSRFSDWEYPVIEDGIPTKYFWIVLNKDNLTLGRKTDIGAFSYINAKNGVVIENFVQIGSHCSLYSLSTIDNKGGKIHLKKNCRIGTHSVVMPGVTIGENSIIGAFSFVTKDIPDNVLAYGVPTRVVRDLTAEELQLMANEAESK
ncbi:DapH/DapD/GlmU-related protein [Methanoregula sp.]|uniref:acyltransferase n=1 Tax=Methanoregula sp. TaxID=2052170 RepID=UPI000CC35B89|nr:acyltransferase [Methanoregula sp.]PKG31514.1 MAG: acetyltransferase [Methanoregula sp.]